MRRISVIAVIFMFLGICGGGYAQTPVEIHTGGKGAVSNTNPLYVAGSMTLSGGALETTQLLIQGILQGLSDKTVTTTQAAQMLTQLLKLKFTGDDLKVVFSNASLPVTQSGTWNIGSITTLPNVTIGAMPAITGAVTANAGTGWADSGIAKETGGNLADIKGLLTDATYSETIVELTCTDTSLWYDYALPANTVSYDIKARTGYDFKVSKSDSGSYQTTWAGDTLKREVTSGVLSDTLYFNSPDSAGLILEIRVCIKNS